MGPLDTPITGVYFLIVSSKVAPLPIALALRMKAQVIYAHSTKNVNVF